MAPIDYEGRLEASFFGVDVVTVARALIGAVLLVDGVGGIIVETEAYDASDPASHCFHGPTPRNASMFGPPGRAYVYRSHGLHWCLNFVCSNASGVLIRALEPTSGLDRMAERRGISDIRRLCAGPGRLCQALAVDKRLDGQRLDGPPFALWLGEQPVPIVAGPRIGISRGVDTPWRFCHAGSHFLSRPIVTTVRPS